MREPSSKLNLAICHNHPSCVMGMYLLLELEKGTVKQIPLLGVSWDPTKKESASQAAVHPFTWWRQSVQS